MKTLVIVDIQKKYSKNFEYDYLKKIINYLNKNGKIFNRIICIMENNKVLGDYLNKEIYSKTSLRPIFKCYDEDYSYEKIKRSNKFEITKSGLKPLFNIPYGDFYFQDGNGYIVGTRNEKEIQIDYMSKDLYFLMNLIRNDDIYIIGGGLNNCVKKTSNYLKFLGISSNILKDLCYEIYPVSNPCSIKNFEIFIENNQKD